MSDVTQFSITGPVEVLPHEEPRRVPEGVRVGGELLSEEIMRHYGIMATRTGAGDPILLPGKYRITVERVESGKR